MSDFDRKLQELLKAANPDDLWVAAVVLMCLSKRKENKQ